jgi:hypothetical protein
MATPAPLGPPPDEAIYKDPLAVKAALQNHVGEPLVLQNYYNSF